jgi:hypothetical protein
MVLLLALAWRFQHHSAMYLNLDPGLTVGRIGTSIHYGTVDSANFAKLVSTRHLHIFNSEKR